MTIQKLLLAQQSEMQGAIVEFAIVCFETPDSEFNTPI